ncbi:protein TIFY 5A-like [Punica granatum]|uniref:Protein TIFY n=2 Tax=Punica granatum TaxID=22663 RepID=A0A218VTH5_PUNGR|nr:protein TIFY 5A-like [Punica granatum]OWM63864.1 hypothetical protein CDL15_Pgr006126 [Punica granatum]PKI68029.1 hypothetical protein CRG98_011625 [Punica granatum]
MKKKLNLEPVDPSPSQPLLPIDDQQRPVMSENHAGTPGHQQPLTIFYNGQVCVLNVTDLQARTIFYIARREMEERMKSPNESKPPSPNVQSYGQLSSPINTLSMKRSLQRFLQKRKNRLNSMPPYN